MADTIKQEAFSGSFIDHVVETGKDLQDEAALEEYTNALMQHHKQLGGRATQSIVMIEHARALEIEASKTTA